MLGLFNSAISILIIVIIDDDAFIIVCTVVINVRRVRKKNRLDDWAGTHPSRHRAPMHTPTALAKLPLPVSVR